MALTEVFKSTFFAVLFFVSIAPFSHSQSRPAQRVKEVRRYGTCATFIESPIGTTFIIDSRITETSGDETTRFPGCKLLLARPTIILAGVGLEDMTGVAGRWNSLDEAQQLLKLLPEKPTPQQVEAWGYQWGATLSTHFRRAGKVTLPVGLVSEMLILTRIPNQPSVRRVSEFWDGTIFHTYVSGGVRLDPASIKPSYSGSCRFFHRHGTLEGGSLEDASFAQTAVEQVRFEHWAVRAADAKTIDDLAAAAYGLELVNTDMDERLEGDRAGIAPPYASAQWANGDSGWTVNLNAECEKVKTPTSPK